MRSLKILFYRGVDDGLVGGGGGGAALKETLLLIPTPLTITVVIEPLKFHETT